MEGKTATSRQRRVEVWLPSVEAKERWTEAAEAAGKSLSGFVMQCVEDILGGTDGGQSAQIQKQLEGVLADNDAMMRRIEEITAVKERQEEDLARYRELQFDNPLGIKKVDPRLLAIFADARDDKGRPRTLDAPELRQRLKILDDDLAGLHTFNAQLELMETAQIIKRRRDGWSWNAGT